MKTYKKLCPQMVDFKNLSVACRAARRVNVAGFEFDMGYNLLQLEAGAARIALPTPTIASTSARPNGGW